MSLLKLFRVIPFVCVASIACAAQVLSAAQLSKHGKNAPSVPKPVAVKLAPQENPFPWQLQDWHGFDMYVNGATRVVVPKQMADGKP